MPAVLERHGASREVDRRDPALGLEGRRRRHGSTEPEAERQDEHDEIRSNRPGRPAGAPRPSRPHTRSIRPLLSKSE